MRTRGFHKFCAEQRGAASLEFVIIFIPLMFLIFLIIQVAVAFHWSLSAQKGLEVAARNAAVSQPVPDELVSTTARGTFTINRDVASGFSVGDDCYTGACAPIATYSCSGNSFAVYNATPDPNNCDFTRFSEIFDAVDSFAYQLDPTELTITYEDVGLGKAGRPYVPLITLSIGEQSLPTILRLWTVDMKEVPDGGDQEVMATGTVRLRDEDEDSSRVEFVVPAISSVIVAEDLGG